METIEKVYFSITEVSESNGIPPSKIRYWISTLNLNIKFREGNKFNKRYRFTQKDIETIKQIRSLQDKGLKLWAIKEQIQ